MLKIMYFAMAKYFFCMDLQRIRKNIFSYQALRVGQKLIEATCSSNVKPVENSVNSTITPRENKDSEQLG